MTDISKCKGMNCDKREQCYRYTCAVDDHDQQTWFLMKEPTHPRQGFCEEFIEQ